MVWYASYSNNNFVNVIETSSVCTDFQNPNRLLELSQNIDIALFY